LQRRTSRDRGHQVAGAESAHPARGIAAINSTWSRLLDSETGLPLAVMDVTGDPPHGEP